MKTKLHFGLTLLTFFTLIALPNSFGQQPHNVPEPVLPPVAVREAFNLDMFYQQWIDVDRFPILASKKVSPYAVKEVAWLIQNITRHHPAALQAMVESKVRFSIIAHNERTTEIPEHTIHPEPHFFYDMRIRGGYCPRCLTVSAPEETVLDESWYSITIHEFAHAFHEAGLNTIDPTFENRLNRVYDEAMRRGLWRNTYAGTNPSEYWAQGVGTWFNTNPGFQSVTTRADLKNYDPGLASLLTDIFGDGTWRYTLPATRTNTPHLLGFNPQQAPRLQHPPELLETYRQFTSNPDNDGGGEWVNLTAYNPSQLSKLNTSRSIGDSTFFVFFLNHSDGPVSIYRVQPNGEEVPDYYSRNIQPLNFTDRPVRIGELLLVKDSTGKDISVFLVDERIRGAIGRIFVGTPHSTPLPPPPEPVPTPEESVGRLPEPLLIPDPSVPTTGTWFAVSKPSVLAAEDFTIGPGEFVILAHRDQQITTRQAEVKAYASYFAFNAKANDFPNLANFFKNGGRIELVSHATLNPLPPDTRTPTSGDIVISEIMWGLNGSAQGKQYIELYNASAHTYSFMDGNLSFRFSPAAEAPLRNEAFPLPTNPNAEVKVIDRVSNKGWKVPGQGGDTATNKPLISMYRMIDYTTGDTPDGTLASSWQASTGRVNLPAPSYGTPGAKHLPPAPVVLVEASQRPPMYWIDAEAGTLHRLINPKVENLVPNVRNATSLAVDMAGSQLYWTEKTGDRTGRIRSANLDGTNVKLVKNLTSVPYSIALDIVNGKLYLTNAWGKIQRLNVDGSNFQPNFITGLNTPRNLVLDVTGSKVYWTETTEASGRIRRANLDGSNVQNVATGLVPSLSLAVANGKIYWTEGTTENAGKLHRAHLDGTNSEMLETLSLAPTGIAVDTGRNSLYLTLPSGEIHRRDLDGSGYQPIVTGLGSPSNIALGITDTPPATTDTPEPPTPPTIDAATDVNQDKKVNKTDLLLVVTALGEKPPTNPSFDVNADGAVNIADVLLVIEDLDDPVAAAAPSLGETGTSLDPSLLTTHIDILRAESDGSMKYAHAIAFFQGLLASIRPTETQLLANYPNPFNPETWIPYQLAAPTDVTVTIYAVDGRVVRTLALGHQPIGIYQDKSRAAYWDGKNALGEPVASGVYFYTLTAGEFTATRKMLIRK